MGNYIVKISFITKGNRMSERLLEQKVLFYDPQKCSGCKYCMLSCSFYHFGVLDLEKAYLRVYHDDTKPVTFVNAHCTHCEYPMCEAACPVDPKAIVKDPELGFVTIDKMRCIGCRSCQYACPISIPIFDEGFKISFKCDFCDGDPRCAKFCSTGAIKVVSRGEAKKLMEVLSLE